MQRKEKKQQENEKSRKKEAESMSDTEGTTINPLIMGGSGCSRARRIESKFNKKCNKTVDKIC